MTRIIADISMSLDGYVTGPEAPVVIGGGTPLFTSNTPRTLLKQCSVIQTSSATHLTYDVG